MTTQTLNGIEFVVAVPTQEPPFRYLVGKDYPKLCAKCQAAIDQAAALFAMPELSEMLADGRWSLEDDPERPIMWVYDHAQFCGGRECRARYCKHGLEREDCDICTPIICQHGVARISEFAQARQKPAERTCGCRTCDLIYGISEMPMELAPNSRPAGPYSKLDPDIDWDGLCWSDETGFPLCY